MARHKNMRILATKYAQSARQSDITIQPRCFNRAKTLKITFEPICYEKKITYNIFEDPHASYF